MQENRSLNQFELVTRTDAGCSRDVCCRVRAGVLFTAKEHSVIERIKSPLCPQTSTRQTEDAPQLQLRLSQLFLCCYWESQHLGDGRKCVRGCKSTAKRIPDLYQSGDDHADKMEYKQSPRRVENPILGSFFGVC